MIHRLISYHLSFLILLTSVGIPVFTHICRGQEMSWSSFFIPPKSCCSKIKPVDAMANCHLPEQPQGPGIAKNPCCENRTALLDITSDFIQSISNWAIKNVHPDSFGPAPLAMIFIYTTSSLSCFSFQPHSPPMRNYGRSLLIFLQVFRC